MNEENRSRPLLRTPVTELLNADLGCIYNLHSTMVKIYAHVATFGSMLALSCGAAYTVTYLYQKPEDVKLQELDSKYKEKLKSNDEKRKQMESFFRNMKESNEHPERESEKFTGKAFLWVTLRFSTD